MQTCEKSCLNSTGYIVARSQISVKGDIVLSVCVGFSSLHMLNIMSHARMYPTSVVRKLATTFLTMLKNHTTGTWVGNVRHIKSHFNRTSV